MKRLHIHTIHRTRLSVFINILLLVLAFLIQTSIFPLIPFLSATPNLLLILCFSLSFIHGSFQGMFYGLFTGILVDLFYSGPFGFYALIYLLIGYLNGMFSRFFYEEYLVIPMVLCLFSEIIYHLYIYLFRFLIRLRFDVGYYFVHIVFPSIVFSLLVTLLVYRIYYCLVRRVEKRL